MITLNIVPVIGTATNEQQVRYQAAAQYEDNFAGTLGQRFMAWLAGRRQCLLELSAVSSRRSSKSEHDGGTRVVALKKIVGSEGRACDFGPDFRPRQAGTRSRWINIAAAVAKGAILPPVELVEVGGRYYIRDGHHRISVARANGQDHIDAHITVLEE